MKQIRNRTTKPTRSGNASVALLLISLALSSGTIVQIRFNVTVPATKAATS